MRSGIIFSQGGAERGIGRPARRILISDVCVGGGGRCDAILHQLIFQSVGPEDERCAWYN